MMKFSRQLFEMTGDYLTGPSDYFRLRRCSKVLVKTMPATVGTSLQLVLRALYLTKRRDLEWGGSRHIYWDLSKETTFPHDTFESEMCGERRQLVVRAVGSVVRGRCPSKVDGDDLCFLLDWALEHVHGSGLGRVLELCRDSQEIKARRMKIISKAFSGPLQVPRLSSIFVTHRLTFH